MKKFISSLLITTVILSMSAYAASPKVSNSAKITKKPKIVLQKPSTVQVPNPLVKYNTLKEARKAVGFEFALPSVLPDGYKTKDIIVISKDLAEIFYSKGDNSILYRTAKGNSDISGDYKVYPKVNTIKHGNVEITTKGSKSSIKLANWSKDNISYSLSFDSAVSESVLLSIVDSIK